MQHALRKRPGHRGSEKKAEVATSASRASSLHWLASMSARNMSARKIRIAPAAQGAFWLAAGIWPLLHMRSFEAVTGPKEDRWLVKTIGGLISVIGCSLLVGAREQPPSPALKTLAVGSALALGTADVVYVAKGRIAKVYLVDALAELALLGLWAWEQGDTPAQI